MIKEYRIDIKIRNNLILERISQAGFPTVRQFCKHNGLRETEIGNLCAMKISPFTSRGEYRLFVTKLCDALCCSPEDLFTEEQMNALLETNKRAISVSAAEMKFLVDNSFEPLMLEDQMMARDRKEIVSNILEKLNPREREIIEARFGFNGELVTLEELAQKFGVTRETIRQVEAKALRKLRHPVRIEKLQEAL